VLTIIVHLRSLGNMQSRWLRGPYVGARLAALALFLLLSSGGVPGYAAVQPDPPVRWVVRYWPWFLTTHKVDVDSNGGVTLSDMARNGPDDFLRYSRLDRLALDEISTIVLDSSGALHKPYYFLSSDGSESRVSDCHAAFRIDFYDKHALERTTGDFACATDERAQAYADRLYGALKRYVLKDDPWMPLPW
jgi:hypothetical protein